MDKLKFIGIVVAGLVVFYVFLSILMPLFVSVTGDTVTEVQASPNVASYGLTIFGIQYFNLFLYFMPAIIAITVIVWKLKRSP